MPQRLSRSMVYIFVLSAFFVGAGGTASANRRECKENCGAAHDLYARECNDTLANRMSICLTKQGQTKNNALAPRGAPRMNACQKLRIVGASLDATQPIRNEILPLERSFETGLFRLMRTNRRHICAAKITLVKLTQT